MSLINLRITHKKATIPVLEAISFKDMASAYREILSLKGTHESVIVQTCNRVEVYMVCDKIYREGVKRSLIELWRKKVEGMNLDLGEVLESASDHDALLHLLRLESGLESMVVGEDQILHQVKDAHKVARSHGATGPVLESIFRGVAKASARVRAKTGIGRGAVSIGSAAVQLAEELLGGFRDKKTLLVGAGEVGMLVAKALTARSQTEIHVASRTVERAVALTKMVGGHAIPFEDALKALSYVDLVIVATSAPYYLLTKERVREACQRRGGRSLLIFDLSNPRNVEEGVSRMPEVRLYTIDHLRGIASENLEARMRQVALAERLVLEEVERLKSLLKRGRVEPVIASIYREAEAIRGQELKRALRIMKGISSDQLKVIDDLTQAVVQGVLSRPIVGLREAAEMEEEEVITVIQRLFSSERK